MSRELEEKVAKAIGAQPAFPYHDYPERCARAAIAAVREELEPTPEMEKAGHDEMQEYGLGRYTPIKLVFRAMLSSSALGGEADGVER